MSLGPRVTQNASVHSDVGPILFISVVNSWSLSAETTSRLWDGTGCLMKGDLAEDVTPCLGNNKSDGGVRNFPFR
jgi:hypothetical protein